MKIVSEIILIKVKEDADGNPDEPYYCSPRYLLGRLLLREVEWWRIDLKHFIWMFKNK